MKLNVDHKDMDRWALKLDEAVSKVPDEAAKVVNRGALQIKKGAQKRVRGHPHLRRYPYTINYDTYKGLRGPTAEIGPDRGKRGQAPLGAIIEYGSVNSPPIPHIRPATEDELPRFERAMEALAAKLLEGR